MNANIKTGLFNSNSHLQLEKDIQESVIFCYPEVSSSLLAAFQHSIHQSDKKSLDSVLELSIIRSGYNVCFFSHLALCLYPSSIDTVVLSKEH